MTLIALPNCLLNTSFIFEAKPSPSLSDGFLNCDSTNPTPLLAMLLMLMPVPASCAGVDAARDVAGAADLSSSLSLLPDCRLVDVAAVGAGDGAAKAAVNLRFCRDYKIAD